MTRHVSAPWMTVALCLFPALTSSAQPLNLVEDSFRIRDFQFQSGEMLPVVEVHYSTIGHPLRNSDGSPRNAVLLLHAAGSSGAAFRADSFAAEFFGPDQLLDARTHFIILPDSLGHGRSSKPSDGLRARFPQYTQTDLVHAQYRLLTERLGVKHLKVIAGAGMGCGHAWMWGGLHPEFADSLLAVGCLPGPPGSREYLWRRALVDLIRSDPDYRRGDYVGKLASMRAVRAMEALLSASDADFAVHAATRDQADQFYSELLRDPAALRRDPNDLIYSLDAAWDYDPRPALARSNANILAVRFGGSEAEERSLARIPAARTLRVSPRSLLSSESLTDPSVWKAGLKELLARALSAAR